MGKIFMFSFQVPELKKYPTDPNSGWAATEHLKLVKSNMKWIFPSPTAHQTRVKLHLTFQWSFC